MNEILRSKLDEGFQKLYVSLGLIPPPVIAIRAKAIRVFTFILFQIAF
jgi:hypothetical protein